jgi:hypothetical protein
MAGSATKASHFLLIWSLAKIFSLTNLESGSSWSQRPNHIDVRLARFGHFNFKQIVQYCFHTNNILFISLNVFEQHFIFHCSSTIALWNIFCQITSQHWEYGNWNRVSVSLYQPSLGLTIHWSQQTEGND